MIVVVLAVVLGASSSRPEMSTVGVVDTSDPPPQLDNPIATSIPIANHPALFMPDHRPKRNGHEVGVAVSSPHG